MVNYVSLIDRMNKAFLDNMEDNIIKDFFNENPPLELFSVGSAHLIRYFGIPIWNSEDPTLIPNKLSTLEEYLLIEITKVNYLIRGLLRQTK